MTQANALRELNISEIDSVCGGASSQPISQPIAGIGQDLHNIVGAVGNLPSAILTGGVIGQVLGS